MDVRLLFAVVRRFRLLVACGLLLAISMATLSMLRISVSGDGVELSYRTSEQWASYARVLVAQPGFGWGSSIAGGGTGTDKDIQEARAAAEGRLPTLATLYASFVSSDDVRRILRRSGPIRGVVQAQALPAGPSGGVILPIVAITAVSDTAAGSQRLGDRTARALRDFIREQQIANGVPASERIELRPLNRAGQTELIKPRSKTLAIVVFLAVLSATFAIALVLENLSPRRAPIALSESEPASADRIQRAVS